MQLLNRISLLIIGLSYLLLLSTKSVLLAQDLYGQITFEVNTNVCLLTLGETNLECLSRTDDIVNYNPKWSPDGRFLAYQSTETPVGIGPVVTYVYDLEEDIQLELPQSRSLYGWSPDSEFLLVGTDGGIYTTRYNGSDEQRIVDNQVTAFAASWSPDGSHIVYLSGIFPESKVVVISVEDGKSTPLTGVDLQVNCSAGEILEHPIVEYDRHRETRNHEQDAAEFQRPAQIKNRTPPGCTLTACWNIA